MKQEEVLRFASNGDQVGAHLNTVVLQQSFYLFISYRNMIYSRNNNHVVETRDSIYDITFISLMLGL